MQPHQKKRLRSQWIRRLEIYKGKDITKNKIQITNKSQKTNCKSQKNHKKQNTNNKKLKKQDIKYQ
jgi:hypothetical protein